MTIERQVTVVPYDARWPEIFERESAIIREALGENCLDIYHIGSTAVPGLAAKPIIDIIAQVYNCQKSISQMSTIDYLYKGEWNIPFKYGFTKRDSIKVNLHIYYQGHPEVELAILFRDLLRSNNKIRSEYQKLKYNILQSDNYWARGNNSIFSNYTLKKYSFINNLIKVVGFDKMRLFYTSHIYEWNEYHRIKIEEIFSNLPNIKYDYNHPHLTEENHYHFVFYKGATIVSIAHMEDLGCNKWGLRAIATDKKYQNKGYGSQLLQLLEAWCKSRNGKIIYTHAELKAENFYLKLNYLHMKWNDKSISDSTVDMAKTL